ncbi:MAG: amidohydrolase [Lachnospiraceae bacterium]
MSKIGEDKGRATLLYGGKVIPMTGENNIDEAIIIQDGRVVETGRNDEMIARAGTDALKINLDGRTVTPGIVDTHPHLQSWAAFKHGVVDLFDCKSWEEIQDRIRAKAETTPKGEWIRCSPIGEPHYFIRRSWRDLIQGEMPDRHVLDAAAPDHPVWIQAWAPINPNVTVFNTRGLHHIQVSRNTPDTVGRCHIEKDQYGEPTGRISGPVNNYYNNEPWWESVLARIAYLSPDDFIEGCVEGMNEANAFGVTSIFEGHMMDFANIEVYRHHHNEGNLTMRVLCTPDGEPHGLADSVPLTEEELLARLGKIYNLQTDKASDMFRVEGILVTRGGPLSMGGQLFYRSHHDAYGAWSTGIEFLPDWKGQLMCDYAAEHKMRLNTISVGDKEHDVIMSQVAAAAKKYGDTSDMNYILQHAYTLDEERAKRFRQQGWMITTSMSFSYFKQHIYWERFGSDELHDLIPLKREFDLGFNVSCGSDWGPSNIWEHIAFGETHENVFGANFNFSGGPSPGTEHNISRYQSLMTWTCNGGKTMQWDGIGNLNKGAYADIAIVDRDVMGCSNEDLKKTKVSMTLVGGKPVYTDGTLE